MDILFSYPYLGCILATLIGLQLGSFINVVVWRLPLMMQSQWEADCAQLQGAISEPAKAFNLSILARIALLAKHLCGRWT
jgi:leader peptidase (prepilin peptidase)/N-methyltransferase